MAGVARLARTPDGYLWFGSSAGLVRFDGVRFTVLRGDQAPALQSPLPGETVPLLVERDGTLWVSRSDGALITRRNGQMRVEIPADPKRSAIRSMVQDGQGRIWLLAARSLLTVRDGQISPATLPTGVPDTSVLAIAPDTGTGLWIGTAMQGLWHVTTSGARHFPSPARTDGPAVRPLLQSSDGTLWAAADHLQILRGTRWMPLTVDRGAGIPATAAADGADGAVWIATRGFGVLRWSAGRLEQFTQHNGLSDAVVHDVLVDENESVWLTTDDGVDRLRETPFVTIGRREGLPFDSPVMIHGDEDGSVWATSSGTGQLFRMEGGVARDSPGTTVWGEPRLPDGQSYRPLTPARGGGLWVAAPSGALYRYRNNEVVTTIDDLRGARERVSVAYESRDGALWLGLSRGELGRYVRGRYRRVDLPGIAAPFDVTAIVEDPDAHVWVAIRGHALLFELVGDRVVRRWDATAEVPEGLETLAVEGEGGGGGGGSGGTLWGTTASGSLVRIMGGKATTVDVPAMRPALRAGSVALIASGDHLWFCSQAGIGRVMLSALHDAANGRGASIAPRWFTSADGLRVGRATSQNPHPAFMAADGRLWFSTPAGLAVVDPDDVFRQPPAPLVHVEELLVSGHVIPLADNVRMPANPDRVAIRYAATGVRIPERARIEYRLRGAEEEWQSANAERLATYPQLRPGRYEFEVRAWNEAGVRSANTASVAFRVLPSWQQTWWFTAFVVLATLGTAVFGVYAVLRLRSHRAAQRLRAEFDATLAERSRLARELHDTLLQGFTGITLQLEAVQRSLVQAPQAASQTLARLLTVADATLRDAREMIWDMRTPGLEREDLPVALQSGARLATVHTPIDFRFSLRGTPRALERSLETVVLRVGREAVTNAVKHAQPSAIEMALTYGSGSVELRVRDDGVGFDPERAEQAAGDGHFGISGMRERAERAGGRLDVTASPGEGTTVELSLPVNGAH